MIKFEKEDIICTDKYLSLQNNDIIYLKTDVLVSGNMIWRNKYNSIKSGKIWITGHSDYSVDDQLFNKYEKNCKIWFTVNKDVENVKIFALPLGITNCTNESDLHSVYGNIDIMYEVMQMNKEIKNLVYMNFNINTYKIHRQECYNLFCNKDWVTNGIIENTLEGRKNFLINIRNHKFVLCPRGNGIDTHRLWETLYMGSIPIVLKCCALNEFTDLPILFIDSWKQLNEQFLNEEYNKITLKVWNMDKLKFKHWKKIIEDNLKH